MSHSDLFSCSRMTYLPCSRMMDAPLQMRELFAKLQALSTKAMAVFIKFDVKCARPAARPAAPRACVRVHAHHQMCL